MPSWGFDTTAEEAASFYADRIRGKNIILTGATPKSLGCECARVLAKEKANLIVLAGRNRKNLDDAVAIIKKETPSANFRIVELDLQDLQSCRRAAKEINSMPENFHVLFNNAAIMASPYKPIKGLPMDIEQQFMNHVGHFLFTNLIISKLLAGATPGSPSRIINVSSMAHLRSPVLFDDLGFSGGTKYDPWIAYGQSKTANVLYSRSLAAKYPASKLLSYSLHPGVISTNLGRDLTPESIKAMAATRKGPPVKGKNVPKGTATHIIAGFSPDIVAQNGAYLQDCNVDDVGCAKWAKDMDAAERLWKVSEELVGEKFAAKL